MKRCAAVLSAALALAAAAPAWAAPVEPVRTLDLEKFMGRWHEIMRTPNGNEHNCFAVYQDWSVKDDHFAIGQHCHKGSPTGADRIVNTSARVLNPPQNTKFEASFFGGLIKGRYWVVDHADDYSWMIATTEDGRYPALLSRKPLMAEADKDRLKERMGKLGFDTAKLESPAAQ